MRDAVLLLLILALAVGWFSSYGPMELPDERGLGPGDDRMGESPLVVSGPGARIVTITQADAVTEPVAASAEQESPERETAPENEEEPIMQDFSGLVWMAAGAAVFLAGLLSGPLVAGLWGRIRDHKNTGGDAHGARYYHPPHWRESRLGSPGADPAGEHHS